MCSTPPAIARSQAPIAISPAAAVTAVSAPAHMRSTAKPGTVCGSPARSADVAAERQALVADLRRRGHDDVADPLGRRLRVAAEELAHGLHGHVVGARLPEEPARAGLAERRADTVDEDDLTQLPRHGVRIHAALTDRSIRPRIAILSAWTGRRSSRGPGRSTSDGSPPPSGPDEREDFRLAGVAGASWAAGLAALMLGRDDEARDRAPPCRGRVRHELACGAAGKLGPADRDDPVPVDGRRPRGSARRRLGCRRCRRARCPRTDRRLLRRARAARARTRRRMPRSSRRGSRTRGSSRVGRGCARRARAGRRRGIRGGARAVLRSFEERDAFLEDVARRRHGARPRRARGRSRPRTADRCRPRCCPASRRPRRARGRGSSPPGSR